MTGCKLAIIHISDCHFSQSDSSQGERLRALSAAVRPQLREAQSVLLAITGDIAWSGMEAEYCPAADAVAELVHAVATDFPGVERSVAIVPGNHDCDFQRSTVIRESLLTSSLVSDQRRWDESVVRELLAVQEHYFAFSKAVDNVLAPASHQGVISRAAIRCGDRSVGIWGINTAWTSMKSEKPGSLWVPVESLSELLVSDGVGFNVVLAHHPSPWMHESHRRGLMEVLNSHAQVVLQGHEHIPGAWERSNLSGQTALFVEGGVFSDRGDSKNCSFNVLLVDLDSPSVQVTTYALEGDRFTASLSDPRSLAIVANTVARGRILSDMHADFLDGPGASFSHPRKSEVSLDDIYVYPDAVDLDDKTSEDSLERKTSVSTVIKNLGSSSRVMVVGQERSGKTTLLKQAFRSLARDGVTPVLLRGELLKHKDIHDIEQCVERGYADQYKHKDLEYWRQLPKSNRAVLVDNIDAIAINSEAQGSLLGTLAERFGYVVCTADVSIFYGANLSQESLRLYRRYELQDLGHVKRDELISRWVRLGQEYNIDQGEMQVARDDRAGIINSLMGRNLIPARPVFILVLLQSIEAGSQDTLKGASYGNYYGYLITTALLRSGVKPDELDSVQNYLSELAHRLIDIDSGSLSIEEKTAFDADYLERYDVRMHLGRISDGLKRADILAEWDDRVRFKYRYALYFFAARYLARNIGIEPEAQERIRWLVDHLYMSKNSDLLLFVTHHSNHPIVLDMLLEKAKSVFLGVVPLSLESESEWINQLVHEIPKLVMRNKSTEEYRRERLESKDRVEAGSRDEEEGANVRGEVPELDLAAEMNVSFRVTATLGQVLRNHYGSLTASRKIEIGGIAYSLVGRVLARYIRDIEEHKLELIEWLQNHLEKERSLSGDKAREKASSLMFSWMSWLVFAVIRRSAELLGSQKLQITHEKLGGENESVLSRLISLATELDHPSLTSGGRGVVVPIEKISSISHYLEGNHCGQVVLRRMAIDHVYKYSIDYRDKQRLCSELGISVARQEQISLLSSKKRN